MKTFYKTEIILTRDDLFDQAKNKHISDVRIMDFDIKQDVVNRAQKITFEDEDGYKTLKQRTEILVDFAQWLYQKGYANIPNTMISEFNFASKP